MNKEIVAFLKNLTLLCVEDDKVIQKVYQKLFTPLFKQVLIAKDGEEGLKFFQKYPIDIIISDYVMPKMDGIEMIRHIRKIDMQIPIFLVTAFEDLQLLRQALELHVTGFIKKPITFESLFSNLEIAVKSVLADKILLQKQVELLKYINYQESLTLKKQQKIIQNDVGDTILDYHLGIYFRPKDLLSGDSYTIKRHTQGALLFLIDGMGKGISASVSAMLGSSFVNYQLQKDPSISFTTLIEEFLEYSKLFLLEEEVLSCNFVHLTPSLFHFASFGMPPFLLLNKELSKISSNNPPISCYTRTFQTDTHPLDFRRLMLYSDGLIESIPLKDMQHYFINSKDFNELKEKIESNINILEDDMTILFLDS